MPVGYGDWFWWPGDSEHEAGVYCHNGFAAGEGRAPDPDRGGILLPRLDQWLAMLEEAKPGDEWLLYQEGLMPDGSSYKRYCAELEHGTTKAAPSPEEAAARLWCAVVGRMVTA